jgi:Domain of unknown function (DUF4249)
MFSKLNKIIATALVIVIASCSDDSVVENENELVVVAAYLFEGQPVEDIQLTKTLVLGTEDTIAPPINEAIISLIKDDKSYRLERNSEKEGYYHYSEADLIITTNDHFSIEILFEDQVISAETNVPFKPENVNISNDIIEIAEVNYGDKFGGGFDNDTNSILVSWDNVDSTLYYVVIENLETNPISIYSDLPLARAKRFVSAPAATSEYSINSRTVTHFGNHQAIVYKVNQEYADLYDTREQDSRNLNEPLSNITNGLGVFSAFASDTVYFDVEKDY